MGDGKGMVINIGGDTFRVWICHLPHAKRS